MKRASKHTFAFLIGFGIGCACAAALYLSLAGDAPAPSRQTAPIAQTPRQTARPNAGKTDRADAPQYRGLLQPYESEAPYNPYGETADEAQSRLRYGETRGEAPLPETAWQDEPGTDIENEPPQEELVVEAELVAKSPIPPLTENPARGVLVVYEYRALQPIQSLGNRLRIRVAHWAVRNGVLQPALSFQVGAERSLTLLLFEQPDDERILVSDALPSNPDIPLYMEADAQPSLEAPGGGWNAQLPPESAAL